jgi:GntR family transcriptional regulator, arabinose operon transcriptional repressor
MMQPKYSIVQDAIKSKILDGTFLPHQKISSESELMKQFNVSRHTVRLAIGELVSQGWLYREQGAGTFCADRSNQENNRNGSQSKNIAIISTYISDYIFPSMIRGAESILSENGYQVTIFSTNNNPGNEKDILEKILAGSFDGIIMEPTKSAISNPNINYYLNLERLNIPYLMLNAYYEELEPLNIVLDDEKGGFIQAEHLINLGHRNIVGFFKHDDIQGVKRMKGFVKAHRQYQLPIEPRNIVTYNTEDKKTKPVNELKALLASSQDLPTAIVCYNDEIALRLIDVLREENIKIPDDISIVGFDDSNLAQISEVKLTTVVHPKSEMGKQAARLMLEMIKAKSGSYKQDVKKLESIVYEPKLVIRKSTKKMK